MFEDKQKVRLGDYIEQIRGVSYKPTDLSDSLDETHVILLRANNISGGLVKLEDVQYVNSFLYNSKCRQ